MLDSAAWGTRLPIASSADDFYRNDHRLIFEARAG